MGICLQKCWALLDRGILFWGAAWKFDAKELGEFTCDVNVHGSEYINRVRKEKLEIEHLSKFTGSENQRALRFGPENSNLLNLDQSDEMFINFTDPLRRRNRFDSFTIDLIVVLASILNVCRARLF